MLSFFRTKNKIWGRIKASITVFVFSVSFLITPNIYAWDVQTPDGVEVTQDGSNWSYSAPGQNIGLTGDLSTNAGQTISIDALRALLTSNTNMVTIANGRYFCTGDLVMVNTAGFVFGSTASVQAANVMISTLNIDKDSFLNPVNGEYKFYKDGNSSYIYNAGRIAAKAGGYVVLLSQAINNSGTISVSSIDARVGRIVMAVGDKMTVALDDKSLISVVVDESLKDTLKIKGPDGEEIDSAIKNTNDILADGGRVELTAKIMNRIFDYAVNNTGIIQASSLVNHNGVFELVTDGPLAAVNRGTIDADNFNLSGSSPVYFYGDTAFSNFNCATPGKEIYFEAGKTYDFSGRFHIEGAYGDHIRLLSTEKGNQWYINPEGLRDIKYAWIEDSYNMNPREIMMTEGTNRGNSFGWDPVATWIGPTGGLWSDPANWVGLGGATPGAGDDVVFGAAYNNSSTIDGFFAGTIGSLTLDSGYTKTITFDRSLTITSRDGRTGDLTINSGTLNVGANDLSIYGNVINEGTIDQTGGTTMLRGRSKTYSGSGDNWLHNLSVRRSIEFDSTVISCRNGGQYRQSGTATWTGTSELATSADQDLPRGDYMNVTITDGQLTLLGGTRINGALWITNGGAARIGGGTLVISRLIFGGNPTPYEFKITDIADQIAGNPFTSAITLYTKYGDIYTNYTGTVHFTSSDAQADLPADYTFLLGDSGTHTFASEFSLKTAGAQYVSVVDSDGIAGSLAGIAIDPASADHISWVTAPNGTQTAGSDWTLAPQIEIFDAYGNRTHDTGFMSMIPSLGSFASGDMVSAVDGLATFGSLKYNIARDITVRAQYGALSTTETGNITIDPAAAYKLVFATQPSDADYNTIIAPAIRVSIQDRFDNIIRSDNTTNVAIAIGTNLYGAALSGTTSVTASSGTGAFDDLALSMPGAGYTLDVSAAGLIGARSSVFNVTGTLPAPLAVSITPSEIAQALASEIPPRYPLPGITEATLYQPGIFTPAVGPVYFYNPLTPYDMAAFDSMILDASAYQYVNGSINLVGHAGLRTMFEKLNKN